MIQLGAAYYPELWEESEIGRDIERCREYGIGVLRVGEFAWGKMEPSEGRFELDWLERIVDRLHDAGIDVILCTPTCTPPRWLMNKYPEVRQVSYTGARENVSSRCHPCKSSPLMREKNRLITEQLARRFGSHPGVVGWQIDNELYIYRDGCYCPACRAAFRDYLRSKYGTVEELNRRFGMARWSLDYASFDEIDPPQPNEWRHPSLRTVWRRFQEALICDYAREQADILHRYTKAPVGTDMMPMNNLSYYDMNRPMDVVMYNHYDAADNLPRTTFFYDFARPILTHPFWVTETQVGWNGSEWAECGYRPAGNCYANSWLPLAHGAEKNLYWLFRTPQNGHELAHGALFSTAGRPYRVSDEVRRASADIRRCDDFLSGSRVISQIAVHMSSVAENNLCSAPMVKGFHYKKALTDCFHAPLRHYNVDLIDTPHPLDGYRVVFSPFLTTIDEDLQDRIEAWVRAGGTWIVGPMSGFLTEDTSKFADSPYPFVERVAGVWTKYQKPIGNDVWRAVWRDGSPLGISLCYDAYEPTDSTPLATYQGDEFDGLAVLTERRLGAGRVILLGSLPDAAAIRRLTGLPPIAAASDNIDLTERSGAHRGLIAVETQNKPGTLTLEGTYRDRITDRTLTGTVSVRPYEVLVLEANEI